MWSEIRSLSRRTLFLQQDNLHLVLLFGTVESGTTQFLLPNSRTSARIADTRSLEENTPRTTVVDCFLLLEGCNRRYEYGSSTRLSDTPALVFLHWTDVNIVDNAPGCAVKGFSQVWCYGPKKTVTSEP
jgi:hypothetical protein